MPWPLSRTARTRWGSPSNSSMEALERMRPPLAWLARVEDEVEEERCSICSRSAHKEGGDRRGRCCGRRMPCCMEVYGGEEEASSKSCCAWTDSLIGSEERAKEKDLVEDAVHLAHFFADASSASRREVESSCMVSTRAWKSIC